MSLAAEEPLPYGRGGICQFFPSLSCSCSTQIDYDYEHEHEHEREKYIRIASVERLWNNEAPHERSRYRAGGF